MKRYALVLIAVLSVPIAPGRLPANDVKALQGIWVLKTVEWLGETTDQDTTTRRSHVGWRPADHCDVLFTSGRITLTIDGNLYVLRQGGRETAAGRFTLDVGKWPKVMARHEHAGYRFYVASYRLFPIDDTFYSIYSLEDDTLRWCQRDLFPRDFHGIPSTFATREDEDVYLLTFKRDNG